jgi:hypothetical protein
MTLVEPFKEQYDETDRHNLIEERAYQLYEARGRQDGYAIEDWLQAEHEVLHDASGQRSNEDDPSQFLNSKRSISKRKVMRG